MYSFHYLKPVHCPMSITTLASWPTYRFLLRQVRWSGSPISWRIFHSLLSSTQSKAVKVKVKVTQSCPIFCDPTDCSLPGFSIHGIFQARVLEWVAISFSRGSSQPRDRTQVSSIVGSCFNRLSQGSPKAVKVTPFYPEYEAQCTHRLLELALKTQDECWVYF